MKKQSIAKSNYENIIKKQPPQIMKMSKIMNVISIICIIVFVMFLVLEFTKIWNIPSLMFWSPLIVLGVSFLITIISMMKIMLKDGLVVPNTPQKSFNQSQNDKAHKPSLYRTHSHHNKKGKRKKRPKKH